MNDNKGINENTTHSKHLPPLKLCKSNFKRGIEALAELFPSVCEEKDEESSYQESEDNDDTSQGLLQSLKEWRIHYEPLIGEAFLCHSPVSQRLYHDVNCDKSNDETHLDRVTEEDDEEEIILDDPAAHTLVAEVSTNLPIEYHDIEWNFSVVYSHVWSVPVLYFQLQYADGVLLTRKQVLGVLNRRNRNKEVFHKEVGEDRNIEKEWNFVSQEEHPVTGVPSFFFHPCQTSSRLQLVYNECESIVATSPARLILTWMSMILPAAGFRIPPKVFSKLQNKLELA